MSILFVILLPILGVIVYEALLNAYVNLHTDNDIVETKCDFHDWSHDNDDGLFCITCNYKVGDNV